MKTRCRAAATTLILALGSAAPLALAQSPGAWGGPMTFAALDLNGDGVVTEQELYQARAQRMAERAALGAPMRGAANAPSFSVFDLDGDGRMTPDEFASVQRSRMQGRPGSGMGPGGMGPSPGGVGPGAGMMGPGPGMGYGPGPGMGRGMPAFAEFDTNRDGILSEQELAEARAKRIQERSQQGYPMRNLANAPSFQMLDLNGDGSITPDEFAAGQAQHRQGRMQVR